MDRGIAVTNKPHLGAYINTLPRDSESILLLYCIGTQLMLALFAATDLLLAACVCRFCREVFRSSNRNPTGALWVVLIGGGKKAISRL